jgi:hypothetical protein
MAFKEQQGSFLEGSAAYALPEAVCTAAIKVESIHSAVVY